MCRQIAGGQKLASEGIGSGIGSAAPQEKTADRNGDSALNSSCFDHFVLPFP